MSDTQALYDLDPGVFERYEVDEADRERIKKVGPYDLSQITRGLTDDLIRSGRPYSCEQAYPLAARYGRVDDRLTQRLEEEFKRFVILTLLRPGVPHAPPGAVDMYWHFFILHTQDYARFCEEVWGDFHGDPRFRDHFPSTDETRAGMLDAYRATRDLYVDVFGEPRQFPMPGRDGLPPLQPRDVWVPASDTSGDSYSGIVEPGAYTQE